MMTTTNLNVDELINVEWISVRLDDCKDIIHKVGEIETVGDKLDKYECKYDQGNLQNCWKEKVSWIDNEIS